MKILSNNKKALFNYEIIKKYQAGIELKGWEVKSIKSGNVSLKESYVKIVAGEVKIQGMHVSKWAGAGSPDELELDRERKLLLNKNEINQLDSAVKIKGNAIIPLSLYLDKNLIKIEIALGKGKKKYDKRSKLKELDQKREIERDLKHMGYN
jgi:SsrA-binding protein